MHSTAGYAAKRDYTHSTCDDLSSIWRWSMWRSTSPVRNSYFPLAWTEPSAAFSHFSLTSEPLFSFIFKVTYLRSQPKSYPDSLLFTNLPTYKSLRSWKAGTLTHLLIVKTITWLGVTNKAINNVPRSYFLFIPYAGGWIMSLSLVRAASLEQWHTHKRRVERGSLFYFCLDTQLLKPSLDTRLWLPVCLTS